MGDINSIKICPPFLLEILYNIRKMIKEKLVVGLLVGLILCIGGAGRLSAEGSGLAVYVEGNVLIRLSDQKRFRPLRTMDNVPIGSRLRLEDRSSVRILNSNGSMTRFAETGEVQYPAIDKRKDLRSFRAIIQEVFSITQRNYIPAVRTCCREQNLWVSLLKKEVLDRDDLQSALLLMSFYHGTHYYNRAYTLSHRMRSIVKDDPRFSVVTGEIPKPEQKRHHWVIIRIGQQTREILAEDAVIYPGDRLQIGFHAEQEIYLYQFHTRNHFPEKTETIRLFPLGTGMIHRDRQSYFPARIAPQQTVLLPSKHQAYQIKNRGDNEVFWAWTCLGPLPDSHLIRTTRAITHQTGDDDTNLLKAMLFNETPDTCRIHYRKFKFKG